MSSINFKIDDEWNKFITKGYDQSCDFEDDIDNNNYDNDDYDDSIEEDKNVLSRDIFTELNYKHAKATEIYISTKTKIAYLNQIIDLKSVFWSIPVTEYANPCDCVIKKQMKFNSNDLSELNEIKDNLKNETHYEEYVITHIDNPSGRIKFKDIRKVSIGVSKKDIMSYRCKQKSAFYNCFVLILRIKVKISYKEFHVKIFNTGKLEIPGVQNEETFDMILKLILELLQPHVKETIAFKENTCETVLINSNFNCGFFINREVLYDILKLKYNIQSIYDPCSYPGIQCKFYYNHDLGIQNGSQISEDNKKIYTNISQVSFMIFRTGSVLIVGKCDENVLLNIYEFLKNILVTEKNKICQMNTNTNEKDALPLLAKDKKKKIRRKVINISL
jgi:TATA-box binding protein (TBP) (component of TFIID and TFIIIB)